MKKNSNNNGETALNLARLMRQRADLHQQKSNLGQELHKVRAEITKLEFQILERDKNKPC